jgi:hypothetical protein
MTGETTDIVDTLEHDGGKKVLLLSPEEKQFIPPATRESLFIQNG